MWLFEFLKNTPFRFFEKKESKSVDPGCFKDHKEPLVFFERTSNELAVLWLVI
jgi:hypothetical protein